MGPPPWELRGRGTINASHHVGYDGIFGVMRREVEASHLVKGFLSMSMARLYVKDRLAVSVWRQESGLPGAARFRARMSTWYRIWIYFYFCILICFDL